MSNPYAGWRWALDPSYARWALNASYARWALRTSCAAFAWTILSVPLAGPPLLAQGLDPQAGMQSTCAGLLADNPGVSAVGPGNSADSSSTRAAPPAIRADSASAGIGGARNGNADVILWVGVHADEVRFAKQPQVRVRLCWGGDTLRVVQRDNIPSPVVAGTTYRNVYVAVELIGRVNAQCLSERLGLVGASTVGASTVGARAGAASAIDATAGAAGSLGSCAFLGGSAAAGAQSSRPRVP
jgi:hypothetical protein